MAGIIIIFFLKDNKLSSHMAQISEHINDSNQQIHSYDQTRENIVNLGSTKGENNNKPSFQLIRPNNLLVMIIVKTPKKDLPNDYRKYDVRKERTYSVKSSSILFSCSIREIYNRVNSYIKNKVSF